MHSSVTNVLFVSGANACRSLLAEACLNHHAAGKLKAFSCGDPATLAEAPHSWTLLALGTAGIPSADLHCKSWVEFLRSGAPRMDFVVGLDQASFSRHPAWPGQPITALWDYPAIERNKKRPSDAAIEAVHTLMSLQRRIELLISLHAHGRSRGDLQHDLRDLTHL